MFYEDDEPWHRSHVKDFSQSPLALQTIEIEIVSWENVTAFILVGPTMTV